MSTTQAMLKIKGLQVNYGGIQAVKGIDLEVAQGELVTLIGANGAGKTTTMKAITGLKPYSAGDIEYMGQSIKGIPAHELLKRGLAMVPEGRGIFARMSIVENMQMGAYLRNDTDGIKADVDRMFGFFPRLKETRDAVCGHALGRRTADAGDGARDHLEAEAAAAGRAVDGSVADHGGEDLRGGARNFRRRHDRAAGRAECASRVAGGQSRLCDGVGAGHDVRRREADAG